MPIEPERTGHQMVEMPHQKIGEIKRAGLGVGKRGKYRRRSKELVAVGAGDTLDAFRAQHGIKSCTRTAVAIGNKNMLVAITVRANLLLHRSGDTLGSIMQLRWQVAHVKLGPAIGATQRRDLTGKCAAGNHECAATTAHGFASGG